MENSQPTIEEQTITNENGTWKIQIEKPQDISNEKTSESEAQVEGVADSNGNGAVETLFPLPEEQVNGNTPHDIDGYAVTAPQPTATPDTITLSRSIVNYTLIAITFLAVGLAMGWYLFTDNSEPTATIDADMIRSIVQEALTDTDFTPQTVDRFEFVDDDPYIGAEDAPVVIVEFGDFRCSYCGRHHEQTFQPILENYGQYIRYVFRDFPGLGQESYNAAVAAQCANDQDKFWEFHEELFANQGEIGRNLYFNLAVRYGLDLAQFTECYDSAEYLKEINLDYYDGQTNNVQGTPSFFVNGTFIRGAQSYDIFEREILRELDKAGITLDTQSIPESNPPPEEEVEGQST